MIGFSGGYFIVISTYHKEIGEVNKLENKIFLLMKINICIGIT